MFGFHPMTFMSIFFTCFCWAGLLKQNKHHTQIPDFHPLRTVIFMVYNHYINCDALDRVQTTQDYCRGLATISMGSFTFYCAHNLPMHGYNEQNYKPWRKIIWKHSTCTKTELIHMANVWNRMALCCYTKTHFSISACCYAVKSLFLRTH